ncbi:hypothetical protein EIP91_002202 [Steccherinum ochraceum]|uniref:F-box domain-containing protein n=1 Tax=Steccherinum ochraceum TaxID=92696 RepID=A0A4R0RL42_9APHY|nr:hypothetical protein EIP91_002202 [Steccherinum ochraceum]
MAQTPHPYRDHVFRVEAQSNTNKPWHLSIVDVGENSVRRETPISRLPTEILQEVFCLVAEDDVESSLRHFRLGQVCQRWRAAALGCRKLWSRIVVHDHKPCIDAVRCMIGRSEGAPLEVYLNQSVNSASLADLQNPRDDEDIVIYQPRGAVYAILNELPRIRSLHLALSNSTYIDYKDLLTVYTEKLKVLTMTLVDTAFNQYHTSRQSFPATTLNFPMLSNLSMTKFDTLYALSVAAHASSSLKHLKIHVPHHLAENPSTAEALLSALQRMTRLVTLDLGNWILPSTLPPPKDQRLVACRSLTSLRLAGRVSHINWLLRHIHLPPTVSIDLALFDHSSTEAQFRELGDHLRESFFISVHSAEGGLAPPLSHAGCFSASCLGRKGNMLLFMLSSSQAVIQHHFAAYAVESSGFGGHDDTEQEEIEFEVMRDRVQRIPRVGERTLVLRMHDELTWMSQADSVETIWNTFPLYEVHTLSLFGVPLSTSSSKLEANLFTTFLNFVAPMTSVESLVVRGWESIWLKKLLVPDTFADNRIKWTTHISFPALQNLTLINAHKNHSASFDKEGKALRDVFSDRNEKSRIRNLYLLDYGNTDIVPLRLWMFFMRCVCDGIEQW